MTSIPLTPGSRVYVDGQSVTIRTVLSTSEVVVEAPDGRISSVAVKDIKAVPAAPETKVPPDLHQLNEVEWHQARQRAAVLIPLVAKDAIGHVEAQAAAAALGISFRLVYRLVARYRESPALTSFLPRRRGRQKGEVRLSPIQERIIAVVIDELYLTRQQMKPKEIITEVFARCDAAAMPRPGANTVRRRIKGVRQQVAVRARLGPKAARDRFMPVLGSYEDATHPLAVVQIDHTLVDVIVVDDHPDRPPLQRPWLTLAIDVYSRMVYGYYLSLDPPSTTSVAMCLLHGALPKDEFLTQRNIAVEWPVWGTPARLHLDNAKEFRGQALRRGCEQYGIGLDYRPVRTPHYGGHIERLIGTMMGKVHLLPGTTFSNITAKGDMDPSKAAAMTLAELDRWLAIAIAEVYHRSKHKGLGTTPLSAWTAGLLGTQENPGPGLPARLADPQRFMLDFLPFEIRQIRKEGIVLHHIAYWSDVLRPWIGEIAERLPVRYDPRDLSRVWLLGPDNVYYELPYRHLGRPPIALWEHRRALKQIKERGDRQVDEAAVFAGIAKMRAIADQAAAATKSARRDRARRPALPPPPTPPALPAPPSATGPEAEAHVDPVPYFDDIEVWS